VCPKDCEGDVRFRNDFEGANVWMMDDADGTSAHNVQDEGESCKGVLNQLSAEDEMRIEGVK
jgi:hypothetical protein